MSQSNIKKRAKQVLIKKKKLEKRHIPKIIFFSLQWAFEIVFFFLSSLFCLLFFANLFTLFFIYVQRVFILFWKAIHITILNVRLSYIIHIAIFYLILFFIISYSYYSIVFKVLALKRDSLSLSPIFFFSLSHYLLCL